jgi:hypothetical protein
VLRIPSIWIVQKEVLCVCPLLLHITHVLGEILLYSLLHADVVGISSMVCITQMKAKLQIKVCFFQTQVAKEKEEY